VYVAKLFINLFVQFTNRFDAMFIVVRSPNENFEVT